jgi:hypothetical protein
MDVIKTFHLNINSANRQEGTNWDFTVDVPHELNIAVDKEKNQSIKLTLLKMSTYLEFYNITAGETDTITFKKLDNNKNVIQTLTATLPQGNYTYSQLASGLSNPICTVSYIARLNKFQFNFNNYKGTLTFYNKSHRAFGFSQADISYNSVIEGVNNVIYSENALKPRTFDRLNINLYNVTPSAENYINDNKKVDSTGGTMPGKYFQRSRLMTSIAVNNAPFTLLNYEEGSTDSQGLVLHDKRLKKLRFVITNEYGEELKVLKDTFMVIRVEIIEETKNNEVLKMLQQINEYAKLFFIQQNLK